MNLVLRHTEFLLSTHDCVVVPGLGTFLATECKAQYNVEKNLWMKPHRSFSFNESLKVSDGLLIMSVSRSLHNDYDKAKSLVEKGVDEIRAELIRTGEFGFGRIGRLEMTFTGDTRFVPYSSDKISPLSNWIPDVKCEFGNQLAENPQKDKKDKIDISEIKPTPFGWNKWIRNTIGAVAAILIAIIVSTPVKMSDTYSASTVPPVSVTSNNSSGNLTSISGTKSSTKIEDKSSALLSGIIFKNCASQLSKYLKVSKMANENTVHSVSEPAMENSLSSLNPNPGAPHNVSENDDVSEVRFNNDDEYILVVASLASRKDADKFLNQYSRLKGVSFGVVDCGNKFRVYAATGSSASEAYAQRHKDSIALNFKDSWVTHKN